MIKYLAKISLFSLAFFIFSCSSQQKSLPKSGERFITNITDDGVKRFSYQIEIDKKRSKSRGGHGRPDGRTGATSKSKNKKTSDIPEEALSKIDAKLLEKLADTQFCHNGFKEIDRYFNKGVIRIRGECNDLATKSDKANF